MRTVRDDCLDHLLVVSQRHLEALLAEYVRHYNEARPHRALELDQPLPRPANVAAEARSSVTMSSAALSTSTSALPETPSLTAEPTMGHDWTSKLRTRSCAMS